MAGAEDELAPVLVSVVALGEQAASKTANIAAVMTGLRLERFLSIELGERNHAAEYTALIRWYK